MNLEFDQHPFLKELGIEANNLGAYYNGKWQGSGEVLHSLNPSTEAVIATTKGASLDDYENAISGMVEAKAKWAKVKALSYLDAHACKRINCQTNWRCLQSQERTPWKTPFLGDGKNLL